MARGWVTALGRGVGPSFAGQTQTSKTFAYSEEVCQGLTCHEHRFNSASMETSWSLWGLFLGTTYPVKKGEKQLPHGKVYWGQM